MIFLLRGQSIHWKLFIRAEQIFFIYVWILFERPPNKKFLLLFLTSFGSVWYTRFFLTLAKIFFLLLWSGIGIDNPSAGIVPGIWNSCKVAFRVYSSKVATLSLISIARRRKGQLQLVVPILSFSASISFPESSVITRQFIFKWFREDLFRTLLLGCFMKKKASHNAILSRVPCYFLSASVFAARYVEKRYWDKIGISGISYLWRSLVCLTRARLWIPIKEWNWPNFGLKIVNRCDGTEPSSIIVVSSNLVGWNRNQGIPICLLG